MLARHDALLRTAIEGQNVVIQGERLERLRTAADEVAAIARGAMGATGS